jgi:hypothetical protein
LPTWTCGVCPMRFCVNFGKHRLRIPNGCLGTHLISEARRRLLLQFLRSCIFNSVIQHLLIKSLRGAALTAVETMHLTESGILGQTPSSPIRQVLLLAKSTLDEFNLHPGQLRENIVIDMPDLYSLPSGSVIAIGQVELRLTVLCEPCHVIGDIINPKKILYKRGYLASVAKVGSIHKHDKIGVELSRFESIPYAIHERIAWYLSKVDSQVSATDLIYALGFTKSLCRALPSIIKKYPRIDASKIYCASSIKKNSNMLEQQKSLFS